MFSSNRFQQVLIVLIGSLICQSQSQSNNASTIAIPAASTVTSTQTPNQTIYSTAALTTNQTVDSTAAPTTNTQPTTSPPSFCQPLLLANGQVNPECSLALNPIPGIPENFTCFYVSCHNGYVLSGNGSLQRVCQRNNSYSGTPWTCESRPIFYSSFPLIPV